MDQLEQTRKFGVELEKLCDYFAAEFDLTYESMIGVLEIEKARRLNDLFGDDED